MNESDLSDTVTETVAGALYKLSSKMALSVSEEMTQQTGESLDADRRKPLLVGWAKTKQVDHVIIVFTEFLCIHHYDHFVSQLGEGNSEQ